jgi:hypothetical protein
MSAIACKPTNAIVNYRRVFQLGKEPSAPIYLQLPSPYLETVTTCEKYSQNPSLELSPTVIEL